MPKRIYERVIISVWCGVRGGISDVSEEKVHDFSNHFPETNPRWFWVVA